MKGQSPAERLLERFVPLVQARGFTYRKSGHRFLRRFAHGHDAFHLVFDGRGGLVSVTANYFVHFDSLERQLQQVIGRKTPWSAGSSFANAGFDPWNAHLFDDQFASLTPQQRSGIPSELVHPAAKLEAAIGFLEASLSNHVEPFFGSLHRHEQLEEFYLEYLEAGCVGRFRPLPQNTVYFSILLAAALGHDLERPAAFAQGMSSVIVGEDVEANAQAIVMHVRSGRFD